MEIKDIYVNIVIRLSPMTGTLFSYIQRRKPINGICIWNHSFRGDTIVQSIPYCRYANIHLLCGDIRY